MIIFCDKCKDISYTRIINEYKNFNNLYIENRKNFLFDEFEYKIITIDYNHIFIKCNIQFLYKNNKYVINIYYSKNYPFIKPSKIELNNCNILDIYKNIMIKNNDLIKEKDNNFYICSNNWSVNYTIENILNQIIKIIDYNDLYIKRNLLNKIINAYTNEDLNYLHYYLL